MAVLADLSGENADIAFKGAESQTEPAVIISTNTTDRMMIVPPQAGLLVACLRLLRRETRKPLTWIKK
jgi:hypothetical protein